MPQNKVDLVGSVLDSLVLSGTVKQWSRHLVASTARHRRTLADVYDVQVAAELSDGDQSALRDLLEQHGRTSLTHSLEVRFRRPS